MIFERRSSPNFITIHDEDFSVGLSASRWHGSLYSHCQDVLDREGLVPFIVEQSEVAGGLRRRGLGVELYVAAVEEAAKYGGALVASECVVLEDAPVPEERGFTSESARRVWRSQRFAERVHVDGLVAWLPAPTSSVGKLKSKLLR